MSSQRLVLGLPRVLPSLPPSLAPPCRPCVEGRLRATPHSSSLRPATEPFETLHLDVWGPAPRLGPERERYFLVVVDDFSRYTTVFPLAKKSEVTSTLIRWLLTTEDTRGRRVNCLHSDRGGEFRSGILAGFCHEQGIRQSWMLPESPQQNGVAERRIGLVMEIARTSLTHACAPHFLWPYVVRYAAHQLNLWPRVSRPEVSPTSLWTGSPGVASRFRVWGCLALVRDTFADKLSPRAVPCVFLGFPEDSSDFTFYHPPSHRFFDSRDRRGQARFEFVESEANTADIFTKALPPCDHQRCCVQLGLVDTGSSHTFVFFWTGLANTADIFTKALAPGDHQRFCTMLACFALFDWSCDLLFSPTLPMGEPLTPQQPTTPAHVQAAHDFVTTMQQLWEKTQRRLTIMQTSQKQYADRQRRDHSVAVRDQVLLDTRNLNLSHLPSKLRPRFCGRLLVEAQVTPVTFRLRLPDTWKLHNAFHVQLLKPYKDPNQQFQGWQLLPPPPILVQDEPEYEVERVLTHRRRGGKTLEFLLRWKGYNPTEDSWVVEADMGNARRALKDYLVKQGVSHATQL
ncbi:unnamed protein product [Closterium sp. NIES-53]